MTPRFPECVRLDLPARFAYLHLISECIADMLRFVDGIADAEALVYSVQLAAHEVCTNIVNHAYGGSGDGRIQIVVTLSFEELCLQIDLYDTGKPFDLDTIPPPDLDEVRIHGYGLFLIRHLMDTVIYTPSPGHNHWRLTKSFVTEQKGCGAV